MFTGIAILLSTVLYLIDKNGKWHIAWRVCRITFNVAISLALVAGVGVYLYYHRLAAYWIVGIAILALMSLGVARGIAQESRKHPKMAFFAAVLCMIVAGVLVIGAAIVLDATVNVATVLGFSVFLLLAVVSLPRLFRISGFHPGQGFLKPRDSVPPEQSRTGAASPD